MLFCTLTQQLLRFCPIVFKPLLGTMHGWTAALGDDETCARVYPPMNLSTGSLDQLMDTVLLNLLVPESRIKLDNETNLGYGLSLSGIEVYQLNTIRRTCSIELLTNDSLGCSSRGLLLKACLGADEIRADLNVSSWVHGSSVSFHRFFDSAYEHFYFRSHLYCSILEGKKLIIWDIKIKLSAKTHHFD